MRQVLILAILALAVLAAEKNCTSVSAPASTANYFMPPSGCVQNDTSVAACMSGYSACAKAAKDCGSLNKCYIGRIICLIASPAQAPECTTWSTGLDNAGLYITAGGTYKDSTLERACEYGLCQGNQEAFTSHNIKTPEGLVCPSDFAAVCAAAPSFDAPTRAPSQPEYTVTFGGAEWATVLANATKDSAKYKEIEAALGKGLSKVLGVPAWLIIITEIKVGSLVVKFIVREDPTGQTAPINPNDAITKLNDLVSNSSVVQSSFAELATASGVTLTVTGVVGDVPTPTPNPNSNTTNAPSTDAPSAGTPAPNNGTLAPSASGLVSVAAAVVAIVAMML